MMISNSFLGDSTFHRPRKISAYLILSRIIGHSPSLKWYLMVFLYDEGFFHCNYIYMKNVCWQCCSALTILDYLSLFYVLWLFH